MPPLKSSLIKPSKSMIFFYIWNANFSVTPIKCTWPSQKKSKKISENTGKTFSVIMPSFTCRGWAYLRKVVKLSSHMYFLPSGKRNKSEVFTKISILVEAQCRAELTVFDDNTKFATGGFGVDISFLWGNSWPAAKMVSSSDYFWDSVMTKLNFVQSLLSYSAQCPGPTCLWQCVLLQSTTHNILEPKSGTRRSLGLNFWLKRWLR